MGMEHLLNTASPSSGFIEEMRELEKLRTETMMKSCQSTTSRAGAIRCPVPRKSGRSYKEYDLTQDLSDFIMSKRLLLHTLRDLHQFEQAIHLYMIHSSVHGSCKTLISRLAFLYQQRVAMFVTV
ncbi:Os06g0661766 [Oryza sativa Japonica Group]|uniref:Os06g0661766 protein n=1 Tax=Oryza sativa subsp. japonica TaxID=39947 RepID=C7J421_ORYSJ|nr:Os06g0661766 [Oryza sativa Japonica Group]|eukprot:NP_001174940.1 Os06g0661766 [Oryza sativa Japonica Group]